MIVQGQPYPSFLNVPEKFCYKSEQNFLRYRLYTKIFSKIQIPKFFEYHVSHSVYNAYPYQFLALWDENFSYNLSVYQIFREKKTISKTPYGSPYDCLMMTMAMNFMVREHTHLESITVLQSAQPRIFPALPAAPTNSWMFFIDLYT